MRLLKFVKKIIRKLFVTEKKNKMEPCIPLHRKRQKELEEREFDIHTSKNNDLNIIRELSKEEEEPLITTPNSMIPRNSKNKKLIDINVGKNDVSLFRVNGIYSIGETTMLTGFVETGKIIQGMKAVVNENKIQIIEIRKNREKEKYINSGEEGTLVVRARKNLLLKAGEYIEFE